MNYEIIYDRSVSGIEPTTAEANDFEIFSNFTAKARLLTYLRSERDEFNWAISQAKRLKKEDFE